MLLYCVEAKSLVGWDAMALGVFKRKILGNNFGQVCERIQCSINIGQGDAASTLFESSRPAVPA